MRPRQHWMSQVLHWLFTRRTQTYRLTPEHELREARELLRSLQEQARYFRQ